MKTHIERRPADVSPAASAFRYGEHDDARRRQVSIEKSIFLLSGGYNLCMCDHWQGYIGRQKATDIFDMDVGKLEYRGMTFNTYSSSTTTTPSSPSLKTSRLVNLAESPKTHPISGTLEHRSRHPLGDTAARPDVMPVHHG